MNANLQPEVERLIQARDFSALRGRLEEWSPAELAGLLVQLRTEDQVIVLRILSSKVASTVFEYLNTPMQEALLKAMAQDDVAALLNNMAPDARTHLLEKLPASVTKEMLALLTPDEHAIAVSLLGYPEDSIGRLMTPDYVKVREDWSVARVLEHIRQYGQDSETLSTIYVVDEQDVLIDDIRIRNFLLTSPTTLVSELMDRRFIALKAVDDQETAIAVFLREDLTALPVTDTSGVLIGIVTVDDVLEVAEAEATEDIQKIGAVEALDGPFTQIPLARMIRKRGNWLVILFLGEMLTATAMGFFEEQIERAVVLALFVPLVISSGGNSGSQAATLVIRALAIGEVRLSDWWQVMKRELISGLGLGSILGAIGFLRIALWSALFNAYGEHWIGLGLTVGLALVGIVLWGTLVGSMLPFALRRFGLDPATSSAPFVATLVDVTGLIIYFSVAATVLRGTLL
jgi:magnesium transporter